MKKNRNYLPKSMTQTLRMEHYSSKFLFINNLMLVYYVSKQRKCVVLPSSLYREHDI